MSRRKDKNFTCTDFNPFKPRNKKQTEYISALNTYTFIISTGPAGTGKTALAAAHGAALLHNKVIDQLVITRPMVPVANEDIGALPGDIDLKFAPFYYPVKQIVESVIGTGAAQAYLREGKILPLPLAFMRGTTFNRALIILDEAQNTTPEQVKMFLTRIGEDSQAVVCGDERQSDIAGVNGLSDAIKRLTWMQSLAHIRFEREDIVRHPLIGDILSSYEDDHFRGN